MRDYIKNGWANQLINPDGTTQACSIPIASQQIVSNAQPLEWNCIKTVYKDASGVPNFTNAQIVTYFVARTVSDGLQASDFKGMNQNASNLFQCGHVQRIQIGTATNIWVRADCLPEMKKDRIYKLLLCLNCHTFDVLSAQCGCPAGKGPAASCKHIGALCYALESFCKHGNFPDFLTCTQKLQEWNKPRKKKVDPVPVLDIKEYNYKLKGHSVFMGSRTPTQYDPRPPHFRFKDVKAIEQLRTDLLSLPHSYALTTLLVPCTQKIMHDHCYAASEMTAPCMDISYSELVCPYTEEEMKTMCPLTKSSMNVSMLERLRIEEATRSQNSSSVWLVKI